jgi:hypothetical protein
VYLLDCTYNVDGSFVKTHSSDLKMLSNTRIILLGLDTNIGKGKVHPITGHEGPEGE